ncbi:hypothetical protein [Nigerium massiliense]|uniref:hypothetical protein n=1 Tax=Nigerium massiliense TaxID=1522317 RepID=UPI00058B36C7|nr:hypothetical protein [Nigerium massiliense]
MTHQIDERSGARLFGGDMIEWSDFAGGRRPGDVMVEDIPKPTPTEEYFYRQLLEAHHAERILLAGPAAARLLPLIDPEVTVDVLVRARTDARTLKGVHPRALLWCGALMRFEPETRWDLVISLDPTSRLNTPDDGNLSPVEVFKRLNGLVAEGGTSYVRLDNRLGIDRLIYSTPNLQADENWTGGAWPGLDQLTFEQACALVADTDNEAFALLPGTDRTTMIAREGVLTDGKQTSLMTALVGRVTSDEQARVGGVQDPWAVVEGAVGSRQGLSLAPSWLVRTGGGVDLPQLVVEIDPLTTRSARPGFRRLGVVASGEQNLQWTAVPGSDVTDSYVERTLARSVSRRDHLEGELVEMAWRRACGTTHVEPVRRTVQRWADWMRSPEGPDERQRFFATPDNVLVDDEGHYVVVDDSWNWLGKVPVDVAICHGLRTYAWRLIKAGTPHPWNADVSTDGLASTLGAMSGVEWTKSLLRQTADIEENMSAILKGRADDVDAQSIDRNLEAGRASALVTSGWAMGRRESADTMGRMARELGARSQQVEWLERQVSWQDARMSTLKRELSDIRKSSTYRLARKMTAPGRAVIGGGKAVLKRAVPSKYWRRLDKVSRRMAGE